MRMRSPIRFGLIGCGQMGRQHAQTLARQPRARLVAVCSATPVKARALAQTYEVPHVFASADELLGADEVDAVLIATRHDSHVPLALAAAHARKPALLEKPLALTVSEACRAAAAMDEAGVGAGVMFNWRFSPLVTEARRRLPNPTVLIGTMMDDRWPDTHWAQQPQIGGGNLLSQGCHLADLLCYLAGGEPIEIAAQARRATHPHADLPDQLVATIRFSSGAIGSWTQGDAGCPARGSKYQLSLFGDGEQSIEIFRRCRSAVLRRGRRVEELHRATEEGCSVRIHRFIEDLLAERPVECDAWDGVRATVLVCEALRAARDGRVVTVRWSGRRPLLSESPPEGGRKREGSDQHPAEQTTACVAEVG